MSVLHQIQASYETMTALQRKIADYAMKNYAGLVFMTLEEVAAAVGSSTTSVIRFTRTLGFEGYADFLQTLRSESMNKDSVPSRLHHAHTQQQKKVILLQEALKHTIDNLTTTAGHLASGAGPQAAQMIVEARRVFIYGTCSMASVAHYMTSCLRMLHRDVYQLGGVGGVYAEEFLSIGKGDTVVLFLFPRYEFLLLKLLPVLREKGVKTFIFTSLVYDAIQDLGDVFIPCHLSGLFSRDSLTPIMFAIDYLTLEVAARTPYDQQERLAENMENMVTKFYCGL